jgi:hypothetical protein
LLAVISNDKEGEHMKIKHNALLVGGLSALAITAVGTAGTAWAASTATTRDDSLATKIAQKFNLKESDVKAVFTQDRAAREAERQKNFESQLTQAVTDGKITTDQKDKIIAKQKEFKAYLESIKDKTRAEKQDLLKAKKAELQQWATDNNIPMQYLRGVGHKGGPGGFGRGHM